jgi:hydrogenase maturation protease
MMDKSILILGVGNLLLGDEGVGIHVAQRLLKMALPPEVEIIDGGTGGFELIEHCRGKKKIIIIDAILADAEPSSVLRFTLEDVELKWQPSYSLHQDGLRELLHFCKQLAPLPEIIVLGIVPKETQSLSTRLSETIESRVAMLITAVFEEARRTTE